MKKNILLFIFLCSLSYSVVAQVKSISFSGDYIASFGKQMDVTKADGVGGSVRIDFQVFDFLSIGLSGGYNHFSVEQDSALEKWDWRFWDIRYRGSVSSDLKDTTFGLSAFWKPVQSIDAFPVIITINGDFTLFGALNVQPYVGGGMFFYTRNMYLEETWNRVYKNPEQYKFSYTYRNFAPSKSGNPFLVTGGLRIDYPLTEIINIMAEFSYRKIIETEGKYGFDEALFTDMMNVKLGFLFAY